MVAETVRNWVKQARRQRSSGATERARASIGQARLAELERRNAELESEPGEAMVGDITQIETTEGPLFPAKVIDCFSKSVIGWSIDEEYPAELVCAALDMAALRIPIPHGAILHSDRGSQYTSERFARTLAKRDIRQFGGRTGICCDNSMAESFFGKLRTESVRHRVFVTRADA